ncbi:RibD family protein [Candidatus Gracilibacteria bacterium]|nr:RibD family protein [Candidatus Gracilibacteria bacterium]
MGIQSPQYITNEKSRQKVHEMRSQYSAILTTTETVMVDDPMLNIRNVGANQCVCPDLLVFGSRPLSRDLNIFQIPNRKIYFFTGENLKSDLKKIASMGYDSIFTECGAKMATELLDQELVDEIVLFIAPEIFGSGRHAFEKEINLQKFILEEVQSFDDDVMVRFIRSPQVSQFSG